MTLIMRLITAAICVTAVLPAVNAQVLEEIIVTAQKREQSLQDVSVAITAFSAADIKRFGFQSQSDVAAQVPNMVYQDNGAIPFYRIRGQGLTTFADTNEGPVGFYVDDVYFGSTATHRLQLFDLERVEVLHGPQGTLYGRNTTAGLVNFITAKPTDEMEGYLEVGGGAHAHRIVEGAMGGPLAEGARGRVSFKYNEDDGWQDNDAPVGGDDFAATDIITGRAQLEFDLGNAATLWLKADYQNDTSTAQIYGYQGLYDPVTLDPCSVDRILANECVNALSFPTPTPDPERGFTERERLANDIRLWDINAKLSWRLNNQLELVSITAYQDYKRIYHEDFDATHVGGIFGNTTGIYTLEGDQFSQELQLHGTYGNRVTWVAGFFYYEDEKRADSTLPEFFGTDLDTIAIVETESWAVFGHVEFDLTDSLRLIGGVRYTDDEKTEDVILLLGPDGSFSAEDSELTGKAGIDWRVSENTLIYGSYATGFKAADFSNLLLFGDTDAAAPVAPETLWTVEGGLKTTFWNGRARFNGAVFYTEAQDKQGTVFATAGGFPVTRFLNYGDADVLGADMELTVDLTDHLNARLGLGWLDSELSSDASIEIGPASTSFPVDGGKLPGAPSFSINGIVSYLVPTPDYGNFTAQTEFTYYDDQYFDVGNNPYNRQDAYGLVNLRLLWESEDRRWYGQAFVENVGDKEITSFSFTGAGFDARNIIWGKPRWWGIKLGRRFGAL